MKMFVMRFRIWFRYLLIVLVVMLGIELCLFMPKEQVVREIETVDEQTGGLVTVDLDTRQITVYRRGLILPRYFPQEPNETGQRNQDLIPELVYALHCQSRCKGANQNC